jgi:hypothetical protein
MELWAGAGTRTAAVWRDGQCVFGPLTSQVQWEGSRLSGASLRDDPVNAALRLLGVVPLEGSDAFDGLGLGRHRDTERWT